MKMAGLQHLVKYFKNLYSTAGKTHFYLQIHETLLIKKEKDSKFCTEVNLAD